MLGARGAGKSSLLASIYSQFSKVAEGTGLTMEATGETTARFKKRLEEMQRTLQGRRGNGARNTGGMAGDTTETVYNISLKLNEPGVNGNSANLSKEIKLNFFDYPGEWIETGSSEREQVIAKIKSSHVVLLAIDTPALMHKDEYGDYTQNHNIVNKTFDLGELLKQLTSELLDDKKLFLFTPVKCEKWVQHERDIKRLRDLIQDGYVSVLSQLKESNAAIAITPVQTLGNLHFAYREETDDGELVYRFKAFNPDSSGFAPYNPKHIEQPLLYLLYFIFDEALSSFEKKSQAIQSAIDSKVDAYESLPWLIKIIGSFTGTSDEYKNSIRKEKEKLDEVIKILEALRIPLEKLDDKRIKDEEKGFFVLQDKSGRL